MSSCPIIMIRFDVPVYVNSDLSKWSDLSTAVVSDCLNRFRVMDAGIKALTGERLLGHAFTVETMVGDSSTIHRAIAQASAGTVLVINAGGYRDRAVWGEVLTAAAQSRRLAGAVIDAAVRDLEGIRARRFPLYARGISPGGPHKGWQGEVGGTIQCGGVPVSTGDLVFGDSDGVTVVPEDRLQEVLVAATARIRREREWIQRIEAGESSVSVLGLDEAEDSPRETR